MLLAAAGLHLSLAVRGKSVNCTLVHAELQAWIPGQEGRYKYTWGHCAGRSLSHAGVSLGVSDGMRMTILSSFDALRHDGVL